MQVTLLGTGEACDPERGNTSLLVETQDSVILVDCGFTVPHCFFRLRSPADRLDAVWISHFHGDHCFGLPLLLLQLRETGRRRPLLIAGPAGLAERLPAMMEMAYSGVMERLHFAVRIHEVEAGRQFDLAGCTAAAAATRHSSVNLALRLQAGDTSLFYSGDGRATGSTGNLARGCTLVFHEAFALEPVIAGHGSAQQVAQLSEDVGTLYIVHVSSQERARVQRWIAGRHPEIRLPDDGEVIRC